LKIAGLVSASGSKTAREQFNKLAKSETKIHAKVDNVNTGRDGVKLFGVHELHDANGNRLSWKTGPNGTGRFDGEVAFVDGGDGNKVYKETTITIFTKSFDEAGMKEKRDRAKNDNLSVNDAMVSTFAHEAYHDTDQRTIDAIRTRQDGGTDNFNVEQAARTNAEYKVYNEVKENRSN